MIAISPLGHGSGLPATASVKTHACQWKVKSMTIDPNRIRTISQVCAVLARHASSADDRELFAGLSAKWLSVALDRERADLVELDRFEDDGGAASVGQDRPTPSCVAKELCGEGRLTAAAPISFLSLR